MPLVALVVSGGHTSLFRCHFRTFRLVGRTIDDGAGEALDKGPSCSAGYPAAVIDASPGVLREGSPSRGTLRRRPARSGA